MLRPLLLLLIAAALAPAAPVPKGAETKLYFPTAVGAKWVYTRGEDDDEEVVVADVEKDGDAWVVHRKRPNGSAAMYLPVTVSAAGLTQPKPTNGSGGPVCLLKAGAKAGDAWDVPGGKRNFVGEETVEVAAGMYTALKVAWEGADGERITYWYAAGVGEVKKVRRDADGTETVLRSLKAFTPGK